MLFATSWELQRLKEQLFSTHGLDNNATYLGIHIRTGRSVGERLDRMGGATLESMFACVQRIESASRLPNRTKWYIASDDAEAATVLATWLQRQGLPRDKVMSLHDINGTIAHIGQQASQREGSLFALFDFNMLRDSATVMNTYSGFSTCASLAGGHTQRIGLPECRHAQVQIC